jgi:hypothetical protein
VQSEVGPPPAVEVLHLRNHMVSVIVSNDPRPEAVALGRPPEGAVHVR